MLLTAHNVPVQLSHMYVREDRATVQHCAGAVDCIMQLSDCALTYLVIPSWLVLSDLDLSCAALSGPCLSRASFPTLKTCYTLPCLISAHLILVSNLSFGTASVQFLRAASLNFFNEGGEGR